MPTHQPQLSRWRWIRQFTAGLSSAELRGLLRGDPPTGTPDPRSKAHRSSFLLHLRPRTFHRPATGFSKTYYLGFFAVFLLVIETLTGLFLMVYYQPTPEGAYPSIQRIVAEVPFGALLRDIHRLAGEIMIVCVVLHLLRVFLSGAYKGKRQITWMMGVALLFSTLGMAFTGYLRPWDQRAYWAVTIGTSIVEAVPWVGPDLTLLMRGGPHIGASGLLRFNLLHILALPLLSALLLGGHYYRVSRAHRRTRPAALDAAKASHDKHKGSGKRVPFLPDMLTRELLLACIGLLVMVSLACFFYDAPLEHHADPRRTPLDTQAPWFFLWLQGLLKLGDKVLMGVILPLLMGGILLLTPLIDRTPENPIPPHHRIGQRPIALAVAAVSVSALGLLSYLGTHHYGIHLPPAERIAQDLAPQEGRGPLHGIPFDQLMVGLYDIDTVDANSLPPALGHLFAKFSAQVKAALHRSLMPKATGIMVVEDWQKDLKRITLRITWEDPNQPTRKSFERIVHLHRERH
jgi:quinol-cytochrome oxidoreductase complex cytochrome b subunit